MGLFLLEFKMNKTRFLPVLFSFFLVACSKQPVPFQNYDNAQASIKALNAPIKETDNETIVSEKVIFPFSTQYLTKRHRIYQRMQAMELTTEQTNQLNYLIIAERFPERYFSWPVQSNVLNNLLSKSPTDAQFANAATWVKFTQDQLDSALQSNLKLNKVELGIMKDYVQSALSANYNSDDLKQQLKGFYNYLVNYKVRGSLGLRGLANGSEWYQSKLNYFSGTVYSPLQWVELLNEQIKTTTSTKPSLVYSQSHTVSFVSEFLKSTPIVQGLDWQTNYKILPSMASNASLNPSDKNLMLALMETDVGIHYHAWTLPQAKVNLIKRLSVTEDDAQYLVEDIILYPAQSFSFAQQFLSF